MKCIDSNYGSICIKGFWNKRITQNNYEFAATDIKEMLKAYVRNESKDYRWGYLEDVYGGEYIVYFNFWTDVAIKIGCKEYSPEVVEKAIKAFL